MTIETLYSLGDAARATGKEGNRKLLRLLIQRRPSIPTRQVGNLLLLDDAGMKELKRRVTEWDNRPRLRDPVEAV